ncbi:hypothetical protein [Dickeya fangzhongdai]|uniref:hypothetical protein n=1 Tax=Dickeya fangzhongdai TaxID=1778540 RepID=UPI0026DEE639|nr:hypothetical protein [Dickeya fangzhongdai]WKV50619.1 hypothetical protein PL145_22815 [Dickeya fangzhongdai]
MEGAGGDGAEEKAIKEGKEKRKAKKLKKNEKKLYSFSAEAAKTLEVQAKGER